MKASNNLFKRKHHFGYGVVPFFSVKEEKDK